MLIYGIGTDLINKSRIATMLTKYGTKLAFRILSVREMDVFNNHKQPAAYLAKRFAAKEAIVKALGIGFRRGIYFKNISVLSNELGKPVVHFAAETAQYINALGSINCQISISDEQEYALAFVVITLA
jgi:holo-[acyl-carrier protein] synthase